MLITTVTHEREPFFRDAALAREVIDVLYRVKEMHPFFLYAFVMMPDHVHLLVKILTPYSVSAMMCQFKGHVAASLFVKRVWQRRFHIRMVHDPITAKAYIHENPVVALLAQNPEEYPWSSASGNGTSIPSNHDAHPRMGGLE